MHSYIIITYVICFLSDSVVGTDGGTPAQIRASISRVDRPPALELSMLPHLIAARAVAAREAQALAEAARVEAARLEAAHAEKQAIIDMLARLNGDSIAYSDEALKAASLMYYESTTESHIVSAEDDIKAKLAFMNSLSADGVKQLVKFDPAYDLLRYPLDDPVFKVYRFMILGGLPRDSDSMLKTATLTPIWYRHVGDMIRPRADFCLSMVVERSCDPLMDLLTRSDLALAMFIRMGTQSWLERDHDHRSMCALIFDRPIQRGDDLTPANYVGKWGRLWRLPAWALLSLFQEVEQHGAFPSEGNTPIGRVSNLLRVLLLENDRTRQISRSIDELYRAAEREENERDIRHLNGTDREFNEKGLVRAFDFGVFTQMRGFLPPSVLEQAKTDTLALVRSLSPAERKLLVKFDAVYHVLGKSTKRCIFHVYLAMILGGPWDSTEMFKAGMKELGGSGSAMRCACEYRQSDWESLWGIFLHRSLICKVTWGPATCDPLMDLLSQSDLSVALFIKLAPPPDAAFIVNRRLRLPEFSAIGDSVEHGQSTPRADRLSGLSANDLHSLVTRVGVRVPPTVAQETPGDRVRRVLSELFCNPAFDLPGAIEMLPDAVAARELAHAMRERDRLSKEAYYLRNEIMGRVDDMPLWVTNQMDFLDKDKYIRDKVDSWKKFYCVWAFADPALVDSFWANDCASDDFVKNIVIPRFFDEEKNIQCLEFGNCIDLNRAVRGTRVAFTIFLNHHILMATGPDLLIKLAGKKLSVRPEQIARVSLMSPSELCDSLATLFPKWTRGTDKPSTRELLESVLCGSKTSCFR